MGGKILGVFLQPQRQSSGARRFRRVPESAGLGSLINGATSFKKTVSQNSGSGPYLARALRYESLDAAYSVAFFTKHSESRLFNLLPITLFVVFGVR